jgi:hypothetical protein
MNVLHLSNELMGLLCLAAFWVTVLLVAGDVWSEIRDLMRLRRRLTGARRGEVARGARESGALATCALEQRGHALDGETPTVDVSHGIVECALHGGEVRIDGALERIEADGDALVWLAEEAFEVGAEEPPDFEACAKRAASPRGFRRPLEIEVKEGDEVWVAPGLVSTFEPRGFVSKHLRKWALYGVAHLSTAALFTAVALSAPMETWTAKLGAALCLAHFLGSPPILRAVRAATRTPEEARRFWTWRAA